MSRTSSFSFASSKNGRNLYVHVIAHACAQITPHQHDGKPPQTSAERQEFKKRILAMKVKIDEENFDEAEAQAYRCWTETKACLHLHACPILTIPGTTRDRGTLQGPSSVARNPPPEPIALFPPPRCPRRVYGPVRNAYPPAHVHPAGHEVGHHQLHPPTAAVQDAGRGGEAGIQEPPAYAHRRRSRGCVCQERPCAAGPPGCTLGRVRPGQDGARYVYPVGLGVWW